MSISMYLMRLVIAFCFGAAIFINILGISHVRLTITIRILSIIVFLGSGLMLLVIR